MKLFAKRKTRRAIVATYPDGREFPLTKTPHGWQYHMRGSCAFPLSVAKAEAIAEGAILRRVEK